MGQALGCHCLPWCHENELACDISLRGVVLQSNIRRETKTKDNAFVTVVASVRYRALSEKAAATYNKLFSAVSLIQAYVIAAIGVIVPKLNLDTLLEQKNDIAKAMEDKIGKAMLARGYEIVQILIIDIEPDVHVNKDGRLQNQVAHRVRIETN